MISVFDKNVSEAEFQRSALKYLWHHPKVAWVARMNTGAKGRIKFGFPGLSDIIGQTRDGKFIAIELKRLIIQKKGYKVTQATTEQVDFIEKININGGYAGIAVDIDDINHILDANYELTKSYKNA